MSRAFGLLEVNPHLNTTWQSRLFLSYVFGQAYWRWMAFAAFFQGNYKKGESCQKREDRNKITRYIEAIDIDGDFDNRVSVDV